MSDASPGSDELSFATLRCTHAPWHPVCRLLPGSFQDGAQEFVDLENDVLEDVGGVDLVFDVIGGDIGKRSAGLIEPEERW